VFGGETEGHTDRVVFKAKHANDIEPGSDVICRHHADIGSTKALT